MTDIKDMTALDDLLATEEGRELVNTPSAKADGFSDRAMRQPAGLTSEGTFHA